MPMTQAEFDEIIRIFFEATLSRETLERMARGEVLEQSGSSAVVHRVAAPGVAASSGAGDDSGRPLLVRQRNVSVEALFNNPSILLSHESSGDEEQKKEQERIFTRAVRLMLMTLAVEELQRLSVAAGEGGEVSGDELRAFYRAHPEISDALYELDNTIDGTEAGRRTAGLAMCLAFTGLFLYGLIEGVINIVAEEKEGESAAEAVKDEYPFGIVCGVSALIALCACCCCCIEDPLTMVRKDIAFSLVPKTRDAFHERVSREASSTTR